MKWFKRHLNWTWTMAMVVQFATIGFDSPIPYIALHLLFLGVTVWVIIQKGRRLAWILFPVSALFLSNEKEQTDMNKKTDRGQMKDDKSPQISQFQGLKWTGVRILGL